MAKPKRSRGEYEARRILSYQLDKMAAENRRNSEKRQKENGLRADFLKKYKVEGYESAKAEINARFGGREVYTDEILNGWIEQENV